MKHSALSALLLGGWLLMVPPMDRNGHFNADAPIKEWKQEHAYDSAKECETSRMGSLDAAAAFKAALPDDPDPTLSQNFDRYRLARCVPAEHIYPPAKAPKSK